jgi:dUTP pyrophosphatase
MHLNVKKLHPDAKIPTYAHTTDAGMDLCAVAETVIPARGRVLVSTGLAMAIPDGYVGLVWDKSGISYKAGLKVIGGVADAGYRGEIFVGIMNTTDDEYTFSAGDKVAQMLIQKVEHPMIREVDELDDTPRGDGAFGSTGR